MPNNQLNSVHTAVDSVYFTVQTCRNLIQDIQQSSLRSLVMALVLSLLKMGLGGMQWLMLQEALAAVCYLRNYCALHPNNRTRARRTKHHNIRTSCILLLICSTT